MSDIVDDVDLDVGACDAAWREVEEAKAVEKKAEAAKKKAEAAQSVRATVFRKRRYRFCARERREALEERDACAAQRKRVALEHQQADDAAEARERERAKKDREATSLPCFPVSNGECWNDFYIRAAGIVCRRLKNAKPGLALLVWTSDTHFFSLRVFTDCPDMNGFFSETWSVKQKRVTNVVQFWNMGRNRRSNLNGIFGHVLDHFNWATREEDEKQAGGDAADEPDVQETELRNVFATISQRVVHNSFVHCAVNEISFR